MCQFLSFVVGTQRLQLTDRKYERNRVPTTSLRNIRPLGLSWITTFLFTLLIAAGCGSPATEEPESAPADPTEVGPILLIEDRVESVEKLAHLLGQLPKTREVATQVVSQFDETATDRGDIELVLVAEWWTPFDPDGAFEWSRKEWRADHPRIVYAVLRAMAKLDTQKAIDAYLAAPASPETFAIYLQPVLVGWFESGQPGLVKFALGQPSTKLQQLSLGTIARLQVLAVGPEESIAWAEVITSEMGDTFRRQIQQRIAASIAEVEPDIAADWVERLIKNEGASETLLRRVAGRWARREPVAAFEWLARFPNTDHQKQAVSQTYAIWYARAPQEATDWLFAQGDAIGSHFAPATVVVIKNIAAHAKRNPEDPMDWQSNLETALTIQDEAERWGAVVHLCRVWITRDETATRAWLEANDVPDTYRYKVTAALDKAGQMEPRG